MLNLFIHKIYKNLLFILILALILPFSGCANFTKSSLNNSDNITTIEGKFKFKGSSQSGAGLFSWQYNLQGWILTLKTPISTNFAKVIEGKINTSIDSTPIYTWEQLPLIEQGINLSKQDFTNILLNMHHENKIKQIVTQLNWQLVNYIATTDNISFEIKQDNKSLRLFILNN